MSIISKKIAESGGPWVVYRSSLPRFLCQKQSENSCLSHHMFSFFSLHFVVVWSLCLTFLQPMDCSPPGSSVHGISPRQILDGLPIPSSGNPFDPGIKPLSPALHTDSLLLSHWGSLSIYIVGDISLWYDIFMNIQVRLFQSCMCGCLVCSFSIPVRHLLL